MGEESILKVQNLSVSFFTNKEKKEVVREVSFEIPHRAWVCLVGESGSGKTQTALALTRLSNGAELSGSVLWRGDDGEKDILKVSPDELRALRGTAISYVFQDPNGSLNPVMTIGEQMVETYLAHFKSGFAEAQKTSLASLAEAHFSEPRRVFGSFPHELSGGMKQRVMIAMAFLTGPKLLVADEPTTALDVTIERGIIELLRDMRTEWELACLFITHNIRLASHVADRIYVMRQGRIIERMDRGAAGFVPKESYTKTLFKAGLENVAPQTRIEVE